MENEFTCGGNCRECEKFAEEQLHNLIRELGKRGKENSGYKKKKPK